MRHELYQSMPFQGKGSVKKMIHGGEGHQQYQRTLTASRQLELHFSEIVAR